MIASPLLMVTVPMALIFSTASFQISISAASISSSIFLVSATERLSYRSEFFLISSYVRWALRISSTSSSVASAGLGSDLTVALNSLSLR